MEMRELVVEAPDGRRLEVLAAGPADGLAFVFHTGSPAGLVVFPPMVEAATARGLRSVQYARPGYGGSTQRPGRTVADAAGDVAAILDALGHDAFVTAGWSGGGPHALTSDFAEHLASTFRASVASGIAGWRDDDLAFVRPWGFGLEIARP